MKNFLVLALSLTINIAIATGIALLFGAPLHEVVAFQALAYAVVLNINFRNLIDALSDRP